MAKKMSNEEIDQYLSQFKKNYTYVIIANLLVWWFILLTITGIVVLSKLAIMAWKWIL